MRVPNAVAAMGAQLGIRRSPSLPSAMFHDWSDLSVSTITPSTPPRTVMFGGESIAQALDGHPLSGDFRLLREKYGRRPTYRRAAQTLGPTSPSLFLFFEPRSGYWVISTGSPLTVRPSADITKPGIFGQVYARSGPAWEPFTPEAAGQWEVFGAKEGKEKAAAPEQARAPDSHLSQQLHPLPWLRLHALGLEAPPRWLCVGGFGSRAQMLNGTYELMAEAGWATRPAWQRVPPPKPLGEAPEFPKYIFFWPGTGHWVIGPELHNAQAALARNGPGRWTAESPDRCPSNWACLDGTAFVEDPRAFCRKQRTATGGVELHGVALATERFPRLQAKASPRQSSPRSSPRQQGRRPSSPRAPSPRVPLWRSLELPAEVPSGYPSAPAVAPVGPAAGGPPAALPLAGRSPSPSRPQSPARRGPRQVPQAASPRRRWASPGPGALPGHGARSGSPLRWKV